MKNFFVNPFLTRNGSEVVDSLDQLTIYRDGFPLTLCGSMGAFSPGKPEPESGCPLTPLIRFIAVAVGLGLSMFPRHELAANRSSGARIA
jgi:hypothetical protein